MPFEKPQTTDAINSAYNRISETMEEDVIQMDNFADLYGAGAVAEDQAYVAKMQGIFAENNNPEQEEFRRMAIIFEGIFHEQAELAEWLGPDAATIKTSPYDDIKNGVDSIAEFREGEATASHLGLAIDVTTTTNLKKKMARIKHEIERGEMAKIKYFQSDSMGIRGELSRVPRVVIGADRETVRALAELWLGKKKDALAAHPLQFQILEEISRQLEVYRQYAEEKNQPELARAYDKMHHVILNIQAAKVGRVADIGARDQISRAIDEHLKYFRDLQ
jgi:hypothetical protein